MKIDKESLTKIKDAEELIEFISINRYDSFETLESEEFRQLPQWVKDTVFILDFETEYEMQGLYTYLENSTGHYLPEVIESFKRSDNTAISDILAELKNALEKIGLSPDLIRNSEKDLSCDKYPQISEIIDETDSRLSSFIEEKEFWAKVTAYVQKAIWHNTNQQ